MTTQEIRFKNLSQNYSIIIGENILNQLNRKIDLLCPKTKKIAFIIDKNVPNRFKKKFKNNLKKYELFFFSFNSNEKTKSLKTVNKFLDKLLSKKFNRVDLVISVGGGITGDVAGFIASIFNCVVKQGG